ncbi:MAG: ATP-dependent Clp protease ATP-binding subunit ClpX, partial [bacterium]|nr:ATP-dependent Clp protease ATP-binding subunit ClpX [bacterium]
GGGAFDGLNTIIEKRRGARSGFRPTGLGADEPEDGTVMIQPKDLQKFGFIPEFIGRLPLIVTLDDLSEQQLVEILTKPRNALLRQYQESFTLDASRLEATNDGLASIARLAQARGTGARGLRAILEDLLLDAMFEIPTRPGHYVLDEASVKAGRARAISESSPPPLRAITS